MTLVASLRSRDTLWVVADRRLTFKDGRPPQDDAVKLLHLTTEDGTGLVAYAGLGATPNGTQPSTWMSGVLRGRAATFENCLAWLAEAGARELPRHLTGLGSDHTALASAFVTGYGGCLFTIYTSADGALTLERTAGNRRPVVGLMGSGGIYVRARMAAWWPKLRALLTLAKANDHGKVTDMAMADRMAALNYDVYEGTSDTTVGPSCIVSWCRRLDVGRQVSGGASQFYVGRDRVTADAAIPRVSHGLYLNPMLDIMGREFMKAIEAGTFAEQGMDNEAANREIALLPEDPDETLR